MLLRLGTVQTWNKESNSLKRREIYFLNPAFHVKLVTDSILVFDVLFNLEFTCQAMNFSIILCTIELGDLVSKETVCCK